MTCRLRLLRALCRGLPAAEARHATRDTPKYNISCIDPTRVVASRLVNKEQIDTAAGHLITSYLGTAAYSRDFMDDHGSPPTMMAKTHHMLATMQAALTEDDRYDLLPEYAEFGRVQFRDTETGRVFLLRSLAAVAIEEAAQASGQITMFEVPNIGSAVQLLIYKFTVAGLAMSLADTVRPKKGTRLLARGTPEPVGFWPYAARDESHEPFDQAGPDPFGDVGDVGLDEDAGGDIA